MTGEASARDWDVIALDPEDNVATALRPLECGMARVRCGDVIAKITVLEPIPMGHKVALQPLSIDDPVRKYGNIIGLATASIARGAHVHVHNLRSRRGRAAASPARN